MTTTTGQVLKLDKNARVVNGLAYIPDLDAIILDDGRIFNNDYNAYLDQSTGNVLTILDPSKDKNYSVITEVITRDNKFYTLDKTAVPVQINGEYIVFTPVADAYIDPVT